MLLAIPILLQVYLNSGIAYLLSRKLGVAHCVAALATVVGVLVEVPVMLSVVHIVNRTRPWYEQALSH